MQAKDVYEMLGITGDRLKNYKKYVFTPEKDKDANGNFDYTERDIQLLKRLEVLTKAGLTCTVIKKVQNGTLTLAEAFEERIQSMKEDIERKKGALILSAELLAEGIEYDSAEQFWEGVHQRELAGECFAEPEWEYQTIALERVVQCPACGEYIDIDFEDFEIDTTINPSSRDDDMGEDIVHTFDTEDNLVCDHCGCRFRAHGWVREYPAGAYDSESVNVTLLESEGSSDDE